MEADTPSPTRCWNGPNGRSDMRRIYDISVPVETGGLVYPNNPPIRIELDSAIARGATANVSRIEFGSHTGTHVDAPKHFFDDGSGVDALPLDVLMGPALVIAVAPTVMAVSAKELGAHDLTHASRVLIRTRNSSFIGDREFHRDFTYLTPDGAQHLVDHGVKLVGVDYLSVEQFHSGHHQTHRTLLGAGVVIVEGLDLSEPPPGVYDFRCLPLRLTGLDGAPARAVLLAS